MSLTPIGPKCECGWYKSWVGDTWQCKRCCPAAKTLTTRALRGRRKEINGVGYRHGGKERKHCAPVPEKEPRKPWKPSWAAQSYPEIVACVRDYRKACRNLGVGG